MNATIEPASFANDLGAIVDALVAGTGAKIFVGNVPDVRTVPAYAEADKAALLRLITAYNPVIAQIVAKHPGRVVAVDLFTGSAPLVSTITVSGDGFHPSDAGYQLIADRFADAMRRNGVPLR
jgi:lysophospholipase L1-like esterase